MKKAEDVSGARRGQTGVISGSYTEVKEVKEWLMPGYWSLGYFVAPVETPESGV